MIKLKVRETCKTKEKRKSSPGRRSRKDYSHPRKNTGRPKYRGQLREELLDVLKSKKEQYEKTIEHQTKGTILRSHSRWCNEEEKNTKYFLNLEKRHYKQGTISQLRINNDNFITKDNEILMDAFLFIKVCTQQN